MTALTRTITLPPRDPASEPNPAFVRLLNTALPYLWDGVGDRYGMFDADRERFQERYICLALMEGNPGDVPYWDRVDLTGLIEQRLDGFTFDGWACRQGVDDLDTVRTQAGRRAWMLDLIAEFGG